MTHEVLNQPPPLADYDVTVADVALLDGVAREGGSWALEDLHAIGALAGSTDAQTWARNANSFPPVLRTHDRYGFRIDEIEYHPDYHRLMDVAVRHGLHGAPWSDPRPGAHVARAAAFYAWSQAEAGHGCPISMTYSIVPALRAAPDEAAAWEPTLTSRTYDPSYRPATTKAGAIAGMAMTEKQGGSDVRANTSRAVPDGDGLPPERPQVVLLGAGLGPLLDARPHPAGHHLLRRAPLPPRRDAQPDPHPAVEGQARQPFERVRRDRVRRGVGPADRRGGRVAYRRSSPWSTTRASTA